MQKKSHPSLALRADGALSGHADCLDAKAQEREFAAMYQHRYLPMRLILLLTAFAGLFGQSAVHASQDTARVITWATLRPGEPGEGDTVLPNMISTPTQDERLVVELSGATVRIEGYVLPIDREEELVYEFMLVPWFGACSHAPQPAANQMVHVIPAEPIRIERTFDFVVVTGTLKPGLEKTQLFIMDGPRVLTSGYGIGLADVERRAAPPPARQAGSLWRLLTR